MTTLSGAVSNLRDASRRVVRQLGMLQRNYEDSQCTHSQCHALVELNRRGQATAGELAEVLVQDKSTVCRVVQGMTERGLIRGDGRRSDRRSKPLTLTAQGRRVLERIDRLADTRVRAALEQLSESERATVVEGMALYARALERSRRLEDVELRPARRRDNPELAEVIRNVMTEYGAVGQGFSIEDPEVDDMFSAYQGKRSMFYVAVRDGRILGGAGVGPLAEGDPDVCELRKMYVLPEGRGLGLGRRLLESCLQAARERGYRQCYLETLDRMTQARHLYDKFGFRPLDGPMGNTGHCGCNSWAVLDL